MNKPSSSILHSIEEKLREKVTVKPYDVAYGMASYCLLTVASGKKFTAMFCEKPSQVIIEEKNANIYAKSRFAVEEENIRILSEAGKAVPAILHTGNNFIIWSYLGENLSLNESFMSGSSRLDWAVLRIMEHLAAIHCLAVNTIPHKASCSRSNLEFQKDYNLLRIIESSNNTIAKNIKNAGSYGRLRELIGNLSGIDAGEGIIKGETYNPETIFSDGNKIYLTDYKFAGAGNPFLDIVYPVSWGLPCDTNEAVSKKRERVKHYISARKINDEQGVFLELDYFTILESLNMIDVLSGISNTKAKILFETARRNIENLISDNPDLNEVSGILISSIPELRYPEKS